MKGLLKYLSPFAPDQSGASSVLYDLGGITVICDAGGCTGNICGFDEPRWFEHKSAIFSAGLRDMDAILGRDDKLIAKLKDTAQKVDAKFAAIIGTPVPAVIATDFKALQRMAEKRCGLPVVTIECTGTRMYDVGEEEMYLTLFKKFCEDAAEACDKEQDCEEIEACDKEQDCEEIEACDKEQDCEAIEACDKEQDCEEIEACDKEQDCEAIKACGNVGKQNGVTEPLKRLGVIGATPLDISVLDAQTPIKNWTKARGEQWDAIVCYGMGSGLDELRQAGTVTKNLVVSPAGIKSAEYLKERFKTPYEIAFPYLQESFLQQLDSLAGKKVLIIHQQIAADTIRKEIKKRTGNTDVTAATWFLQKEAYRQPQDFVLATEDEFVEKVMTEDYDVVIADALFQRALRQFTGTFLSITHFAVSGKCNDAEVVK